MACSGDEIPIAAAFAASVWVKSYARRSLPSIRFSRPGDWPTARQRFCRRVGMLARETPSKSGMPRGAVRCGREGAASARTTAARPRIANAERSGQPS